MQEAVRADPEVLGSPNPDVCPTCGKGPVRQLLSSPAIQFKGSGFYITDYAKKSSSGGELAARSRASGEVRRVDGTRATRRRAVESSKSVETKSTPVERVQTAASRRVERSSDKKS